VRSIDRKGGRRGLKPVTEPEKQRQPIIDGAQLAWSELAEDASHPPLVDGPQVVDEGVRQPGQPAVAWAQWRVQGAIAWSSRHGDDAEQREPLVGDDLGIADHNAGPHSELLVPDGGIQNEEIDHPAIRASLARLHPALARAPAHGRPGFEIDEVGGILVGQAARPFSEPCLGKLLALGTRAAKRALEILAAAPLQLMADCLQDELAPVLLETVDVTDDLGRQGDGDAFVGGHVSTSA
jgi:hypothetical protein